MNLFVVILLIVLVLAIAGGARGYPQYGYVSWSPLVVVLVVMLVLYLLGVY